MKVVICVAIVFPLLSISAQSDLALYNATRDGAMVKVRLHVVDPEGKAVPDAHLRIGLQTGDGLNSYSTIIGTTDADGIYVVTGKCTCRLGCRIIKRGYYPTEFFVTYPDPNEPTQVVDGKWQPFGENKTVVLKEIRRPGNNRVFPDSLRSWHIPAFGTWMGFDFEYCDWCAPYGQGLHSDVLLRFESMRNKMHDYRYSMDVSFTNNPFAGAYLLKADKESQLATEYVADTNATYTATFHYVKEQSPGQKRHWDYLDGDSYLIFRTRTRVDEEGNLVGAHYGKILGRWLSESEVMILSDGCFNPIENDVNIEDSSTLRDVLRNLEKDGK